MDEKFRGVRLSYPKAKLLELAYEMINDGDIYVMEYGRTLLTILETHSSPTSTKKVEE